MAQKENTTTVQENDGEVEIDLGELFAYFLTKLKYIIASFAAGGILVFLFTWFFINPTYQATAKLYMVSASNSSVIDLTDLNLGTSLSEDYAQLIQTRPVIEAVIQKLSLSCTDAEFLKMLNISTVNNTRILKIVVTSTDPQEAADIANALAEEATTYIPKVMGTNAPNIAEEAIRAQHKYKPSVTKNTAIGALVGLLVCAGVLTVLFVSDDTFHSSEDLEKFVGSMPLSIIPESEGHDDSTGHNRHTSRGSGSLRSRRANRGRSGR